jgi:hypothetical protein
MNQKSWNRGVLLFAAGLLILQSACEYKAPASPWEKAKNAARVMPEISAVDPAEAGTAGEITLIGRDFSDTLALNHVYFSGTPAVIKSASSTRITVYRPKVTGSSIRISVVVDGAIGIAEFSPYKLDPVIEDFGHFANTDAFLACAADADENLVVALGNQYFNRLLPDGSQDLGFIYRGTTPPMWTDMAVAPDGRIYVVRANNILYRLIERETESDTIEAAVTLTSRTDRVKSLDFSANGTIYGGGKNSDLIVIRSAADIVKAGFYAPWDIACVRVYGSWVYVAAKFIGGGSVPVTAGVWRHAIQADGSVTAGELVLDWSQGPVPTATMAAFAVSENGVVYIGNNDAAKPLVNFDPASGSWSPLFYGIMPAPVDQMSWGPGQYLYAVVTRNKTIANGGRLIRIDTGVLEAH